MIKTYSPKYLLIASAALIISIILPGCSNETKETGMKSSSSAKVVNVLDENIYNDCHIDGSRHIEFGKVLETAQKENWPKDTKVVIYCSNYMCSASGQEAKNLKEAGYNNVAVYEGGSAQWYQLSKSDPSYKVSGVCKLEYLNLPNEKPTKSGATEIPEITAQELKDLLSK
jgi:rhodanese-related sulfurtransferase